MRRGIGFSPSTVTSWRQYNATSVGGMCMGLHAGWATASHISTFATRWGKVQHTSTTELVMRKAGAPPVAVWEPPCAGEIKISPIPVN